LLGEGNREAILDALGDADMRRRVKNASVVFKIIGRVGARYAFRLASKLSDDELGDVLEGELPHPNGWSFPVHRYAYVGNT